MSSVWKSIKKGASSMARTTKGAMKGDLEDIGNLLSLGGLDRGTKMLGKVSEAILPEMPDINIPEAPPAPGATPGVVQSKAASVDLGATEGARRQSGSAKGSRKLRVPLGGLR